MSYFLSIASNEPRFNRSHTCRYINEHLTVGTGTAGDSLSSIDVIELNDNLICLVKWTLDTEHFNLSFFLSSLFVFDELYLEFRIKTVTER